MTIRAIKTGKITAGASSVTNILDTALRTFTDRSILVITSKIVSICEGRVVAESDARKKDLIEKEAEMIMPSKTAAFDIVLTIKNNILIPTAGIDQSNGNGYYILWPEDSQKTANEIRAYLKKRFRITYAGVMITDSK